LFRSEHALCRNQDTAVFFNERNRREVAYAKSVCRRCPVMEECGDHAIKSHTYHGIWGGMSPRELEEQRRVRNIVLPLQYPLVVGAKRNA
jgi:WhiB family redox-sensing transcriptional regulator